MLIFKYEKCRVPKRKLSVYGSKQSARRAHLADLVVVQLLLEDVLHLVSDSLQHRSGRA